MLSIHPNHHVGDGFVLRISTCDYTATGVLFRELSLWVWQKVVRITEMTLIIVLIINSYARKGQLATILVDEMKSEMDYSL